jgi:hypothetical protein
VSAAAARLRARLAPTVRTLRARYDDPEFRQARLLLKRVRAAPPLTTVHFGASESIFISPEDEDMRALPGLIRHGLPDPAGYHPVVGAGYPPRLVEAYLRLVEPLVSAPPLVLVSIPVRIGLSQWYEHPRYGYWRSLERVRRLTARRPPALVRARPVRIPREDMAAYDATVLRSFLGEHPRGYYRERLRSPAAFGLDPEQADQLRYAYFWGGVDDVVEPFLDEVRALGQYLRDRGMRAVPYHVPIPLEQGNRIWSGFRDFVTPNLDRMEEAFRKGYGDVEFGRAGLTMSEECFIDPGDASEHVRDRGRRALAHDILDIVSRLA